MSLVESLRRLLVLWSSVGVVVAVSGCGAGMPTSAAQSPSVAQPAATTGSTPAPCFTVSLPSGWTSHVTEKCGLALQGPDNASGIISVDTEPIDEATVRQLIAQKFSDVEVTEQTVDGEQVLVGTGSVPGVFYIVVQALPVTPTRSGYYAEAFSSTQAGVPELKAMFASIRTTTR